MEDFNEATRTVALSGCNNEDLDEEEHSFKQLIKKVGASDIAKMSQMQEVNKGGKNVAKDSTSLGNMFEHTFRPKQTRSSNALKTN